MKKLICIITLMCVVLCGCAEVRETLDSSTYAETMSLEAGITEYIGYIKSYQIYSYDANDFNGKISVYVPELSNTPIGGCYAYIKDYDEYFKWVSRLGEKVKVVCEVDTDGNTFISLYDLE